jgi:hypothetical protein
MLDLVYAGYLRGKVRVSIRTSRTSWASSGSEEPNKWIRKLPTAFLI